MDNEVKEKLEATKNTVAVRLEIPKRIHAKIVKHQAKLTGERLRAVDLKQAAVDLLTIATKGI